MKRITVLMMIALLLSAFCMPAASVGETVSATGSGYKNVPFSNGYNGFCLDAWNKQAEAGDTFTVADTSAARSNAQDEDVSQHLKILFVDFFEEFFAPDGNGNYILVDDEALQTTIYGFTNYSSKDWDYGRLIDVVNVYNTGRRIPDHGESIQVGNDTITFDFIVMLTQKEPTPEEAQQDFFGYKLTVTSAPAHTCEFSEDWEFDENTHWHECECGAKADEAPHDHSEAWESDENNHWHECECGDKADEEPHYGGSANCTTPATCEGCGESHGTVASDVHGDTEIRNASEPTLDAPGYTGDIYCTECDELLEEGEVIPQLTEPTTEPTTAPTEESTKPPHNVPDTGDYAMTTLWFVLAMLSIAGASVSVCFKKRS